MLISWLKKYKEVKENESKIECFINGTLHTFIAAITAVFATQLVKVSSQFYNHAAWSELDLSNLSMILLFVKTNYLVFVVPPIIIGVIVLFLIIAFYDFRKMLLKPSKRKFSNEI